MPAVKNVWMTDCRLRGVYLRSTFPRSTARLAWTIMSDSDGRLFGVLDHDPVLQPRQADTFREWAAVVLPGFRSDDGLSTRYLTPGKSPPPVRLDRVGKNALH